MTVNTEEVKFQMFMAHIPCQDISFVEQQILQNCSGKYIIAPEYEPYDHLHFLVEMTDTAYHTFSKRIFKDKYKLRGQARNGKPRQYGKMKKINDIEKALVYTLKCYNTSKDMIKTNMDKASLEAYAQQSFKKKDEVKPHDIYIEKLKTLPPPDGKDVRHLVILWMELCPKTRPPMIKTLIWYAYQANYITQDHFINNYYPAMTNFPPPKLYFPSSTSDDDIEPYATIEHYLECESSDDEA